MAKAWRGEACAPLAYMYTPLHPPLHLGSALVSTCGISGSPNESLAEAASLPRLPEAASLPPSLKPLLCVDSPTLCRCNATRSAGASCRSRT